MYPGRGLKVNKLHDMVALLIVSLTILFLIVFAGISGNDSTKIRKEHKFTDKVVGGGKAIFFVFIIIMSLLIIALMLAGF